MEGLNIACFDPLSQQSAEDYVQSVMSQTTVGNRMTTAADIHTENNVSKNTEKVANVGTKRCLSPDPNSKPNNCKKLKSICGDKDDEIYRLSDSQQCTINNTDKSDISELKSLILGLTGTMNSICEVMTKRMDDFEMNIPRQVAAMIDTKISEEISKVKEQFKVDLNAVTEKVNKMETSYANVVKANTDRTTYDDSLVIRNLPETETENVVNKVISVFKDGLRLKDIQVVSAERKKTANKKKHGVVVVKLQSSAEKRKVMEKKRELKQSRNFQDVFIENDIPKAQRLMNNNLRNIVKAIGMNKLEMRGTRVCPTSYDNRVSREKSPVVAGKSDVNQVNGQSRTQPTNNNSGRGRNGGVRGRNGKRRGY